MAIKRRIAFIVSSRALCLSGSRAARATYFIASEPKKVPHGVHRMKKGWQPILGSCGCPTSNQEMLHMLHADLRHEPRSLIELEPLCCPASAKTNKAATKPSDFFNFFFLRSFFLAEGLFWMTVLLGSLQAAPFLYRRLRMCMKGWAKSKPQLLRGGLGDGW